MKRHEFLRGLHEVVAPRSYLEIGVDDGRGLALSRAPTVAVDPSPHLAVELRCNLHLVKATSDEFFARERPLEHVGGRIDMAFIDGMHLFEYALRDFINVERHSDWWTVIAVDDVLPRTPAEAARQRRTGPWAGDVYKLIPVLRRYRPDLRLMAVDTEPTGVVVVFGADRSSAVLTERYSEVCHDYLTADPQDVPPDVLTRSFAIPGERLLAASFWKRLRDARAGDAGDYDRAALLREVDEVVPPVHDAGPWTPDPHRRRVREADSREAAMAARRPRRSLWGRATSYARRLARGVGRAH